MNKRLAEFFKSKGYYVLLFVGIIAIAAVALIGSNLTSNSDEGENIVDLNEPDNNIEARDNNNNLQADNNDTSNQVANNEEVAGSGETGGGQNLANNNDSLLEFDVYTREEENGIDLSENDESVQVADAEQDNNEQPQTVETTGSTVKNSPSLSFDAQQGLLWPVEGNVIMNYSMDHLTYHATLMQFKVNPAIIIDAEVGTEVKSAADGVITEIYDDPVTGLTVTMDIGDGYSLVYGQLKDVNYQVGDKLSEGEVIGLINEPTKYYTVEGSNLYFMVMEDGQTVNPMLLLR
ncbi:peptidoglycan DD-metalloendopeptidase family protein [Herbinix luporum]|uniref:peptidoglycan DD-metalloendopeptidase family protein n=1 Tax=Herbinix luporum TaxID=1679721 RepID=UPI0023F1A0C2|nr:peptidoglycan DD-metalloendopeptidase family protein [Herbinix luporum]MDI9488320.1 peptidoglycan DD-metalloendopeptidase family protein [Bacillota bacterium]